MAVCMKAIGRNIRDLRRNQGMTQAQTAEYLGMTGLHYGRLERGERNVSLDQLDRIAGLFSVPIRRLIAGAFPDEAPEADRREKSDAVCSVEHLMQSMDERERRIILGVCRVIIHDK